MNEYALLYRMRYHSYVGFAFREIYPNEHFHDNWHIELISELLQFMVRPDEEGVPTKAIFNLPPGHFKTHLCCIFLATWFLGRDPRLSVFIISETQRASYELQERCVDLMSRSRFRSLFPRAKIKSRGKKVVFTHGGCIQHAALNSRDMTQKHDLIIMDNPQSFPNLDRLKPDTLVDIPRLLKDPKKGLIVMNTRRLGARDMSYHLSKTLGWSNFSFPAISPQVRPLFFPPYFHYRLDTGEPIDPARIDWSEIESRLKELGWGHFCYQYMQGDYTLHSKNQSYRKVEEHDGFQRVQFGLLSETQIALQELNKLHELYDAETNKTT